MAAFTGCGGTKERYLYVEDAPHDTPMPITNNYDATILPNDQLYIFVHSLSPESVKPFNEETNKSSIGGVTQIAKPSVKGYLVSQSGCIIFPILGRLEVAGKTRSQLGREIENRLIDGGYVSDPVVTVDLMNFHVVVIGEVNRPCEAIAEGSRLTIFEALAQAGDVSMYGMRTNVVVVRSGINTQVVDTIDLTHKSIFDSPYYYLQQNDIIYVEPTPKRKKQAWRDEDWPQYVSIGASAINIAYRTINYIRQASKK